MEIKKVFKLYLMQYLYLLQLQFPETYLQYNIIIQSPCEDEKNALLLLNKTVPFKKNKILPYLNQTKTDQYDIPI